MRGDGDTLEAIDRRLEALRRDAETLAEQFRRAGEELAAVRRAELAVLAKLARLRMRELAAGELVRYLDDTDRRVGELLEVRKAAKEALEAEIASAERALEAARAERARQEPIVAAAAQAAEEAALQVKARLDANPDYGAKLAAAQRASAIAERAEAKAAVAEADRLAKAAPYDADPVFMYLWRRNYGTAAYRSPPLIRTLDAAVARASGYERLRRNYWLLHEIPRRLSDHARRMRRQASESLAAARELETEAAAAAQLPSKERALAEAERRLAELGEAVEKHRAALDSALDRRARFATGDDEHSTRCTELLVEALERAELQELRKKAARSSTEEDDRLVAELERLEQQRSSRQQESIRLRRLHQAHRERVLGLEEVRRRCERGRFADASSGPATGPPIETLLGQFVSGSIGVEDLWQGIVRRQGRLGASGTGSWER